MAEEKGVRGGVWGSVVTGGVMVRPWKRSVRVSMGSGGVGEDRVVRFRGQGSRVRGQWIEVPLLPCNRKAEGGVETRSEVYCVASC